MSGNGVPYAKISYYDPQEPDGPVNSLSRRKTLISATDFNPDPFSEFFRDRKLIQKLIKNKSEKKLFIRVTNDNDKKKKNLSGLV